jgi:putative peptide zinc metalloprotease protein
VRAQAAGRVVWARPQDLPGSFAQRGAMLGHVLDRQPAHRARRAAGEDWLRTRGRVRCARSAAGRCARARPIRAVWRKPRRGATLELPCARRWATAFGGPVPVDPADPQGLRARVPVFLLDAECRRCSLPPIGGRAWVEAGACRPSRWACSGWRRRGQLFLKQFSPTGQV